MKKVSNLSVPVIENQNLNDRDILNILLEFEKNLSDNISTILNECSCDDLYNFEFILFCASKGVVRDLYNFILDNGWFSFEEAENKEIEELVIKIDKGLAQII